MSTKTFGTLLDDHKGIGPGFDLLRLALSVAILVAHCSAIGGTRGVVPSAIDLFMKIIGQAHADTVIPVLQEVATRGVPWLRPIVISHVPMFFALSGFLVTGSAFRTRRVGNFLALRFFRIFPALLVEVTLSAVVIGAIFTTLPLHEYFTSRGFFVYFGNILGIVEMHLPGVVFGSNADNVINANLWTLPSEFHCYLVLAVLIATGLAFNRAFMTTSFVIATVVLLIANWFFGFNAQPWSLTGDINVYYFFAGAMFFHWRHMIPYSIWLVIPAMLICYVLFFTGHAVYVIPPFLTYITVFIGLSRVPQSKILQSGDYSYGIYLYGFPITEAMVTTFPVLRGNFFGLVPTAIICTGAFAFFSWHFVEKRFLKLRKYFSAKSAKITEELHPEVTAEKAIALVPSSGDAR